MNPQSKDLLIKAYTLRIQRYAKAIEELVGGEPTLNQPDPDEIPWRFSGERCPKCRDRMILNDQGHECGSMRCDYNANNQSITTRL